MDTNTLIVYVIGIVTVGILIGVMMMKKGSGNMKLSKEGVEYKKNKNGHRADIEKSTIKNTQQTGDDNEFIAKNSKIDGFKQG